MAKEMKCPKCGTVIDIREELSRRTRITIGVVLEIFAVLWFYGLSLNIMHHYELRTYPMPAFIAMTTISILIGLALGWMGYCLIKNLHPFNQDELHLSN